MRRSPRRLLSLLLGLLGLLGCLGGCRESTADVPPAYPRGEDQLMQVLYGQLLWQQAMAVRQQPAIQGAGLPWSHRSSVGGNDLSVGGDGSGFLYFLDSSGTSWTGGN